VLRIDCVTVRPDGQPHSSGTLLIPGPTVGPVLQALINSTKEMDKKIREQMQQAEAAPGAEAGAGKASN
jgi:hypothetical protein